MSRGPRPWSATGNQRKRELGAGSLSAEHAGDLAIERRDVVGGSAHIEVG